MAHSVPSNRSRRAKWLPGITMSQWQSRRDRARETTKDTALTESKVVSEKAHRHSQGDDTHGWKTTHTEN